jgi:tRNA(fMet)-specific endonuclease VapC
MAYLNQARTPGGVLTAYEKLEDLLGYFAKSNIARFVQAAAARFLNLRKQGVRLGTLDLRIAAIALTNNCTLLSSNLKDFRKVPGLMVEDWIH